MDFEDLLLKPVELFDKKKTVLQKYKKKFAYILVDEFQDTNVIQYELMKVLSSKDGLICAVGDDAQSIYSWRGAELKNMLNFTKEFSKAKTFPLQKNYRSTKNILAAADSVIKRNENQLEKTLFTDNEDGELLTLVKCTDEKDEALQIAKIDRPSRAPGRPDDGPQGPRAPGGNPFPRCPLRSNVPGLPPPAPGRCRRSPSHSRK